MAAVWHEKKTLPLQLMLSLSVWNCLALVSLAEESSRPYNVLFIISDDLTATALSCYGNEVCQTPSLHQILF